MKARNEKLAGLEILPPKFLKGDLSDLLLAPKLENFGKFYSASDIKKFNMTFSTLDHHAILLGEGVNKCHITDTTTKKPFLQPIATKIA